jgi:hypothetical protein
MLLERAAARIELACCLFGPVQAQLVLWSSSPWVGGEEGGVTLVPVRGERTNRRNKG